MIDFRKIVLDELERQDRSKYWLAENPGCGVHKAAVYAYLRGDTDAASSTVAAMLTTLGMTVVAKSLPKVSKKKK